MYNIIVFPLPLAQQEYFLLSYLRHISAGTNIKGLLQLLNGLMLSLLIARKQLISSSIEKFLSFIDFTLQFNAVILLLNCVDTLCLLHSQLIFII